MMTDDDEEAAARAEKIGGVAPVHPGWGKVVPADGSEPAVAADHEVPDPQGAVPGTEAPTGTDTRGQGESGVSDVADAAQNNMPGKPLVSR